MYIIQVYSTGSNVPIRPTCGRHCVQVPKVSLRTISTEWQFARVCRPNIGKEKAAVILSTSHNSSSEFSLLTTSAHHRPLWHVNAIYRIDVNSLVYSPSIRLSTNVQMHKCRALWGWGGGWGEHEHSAATLELLRRTNRKDVVY